MMDHSFSSGVAPLKLIYLHCNNKVSGESLNTYFYTRTSSMVQFSESVTAKSGSFADFESSILKIQPGLSLNLSIQL